MSDPEWYFPHDGDLPSDNRAVAVLISLKDDTFHADIGRYYGPGSLKRWSCQYWSDSSVIAWTNLPAFKDETPVVEHDGPVSGSSTKK